jgi:hypothetical protein
MTSPYMNEHYLLQCLVLLPTVCLLILKCSCAFLKAGRFSQQEVMNEKLFPKEEFMWDALKSEGDTN